VSDISIHAMVQPGCISTVAVRVPFASPFDPDALTRTEIEGRRQAFVYEAFLRGEVPGFEASKPSVQRPYDKFIGEPAHSYLEGPAFDADGNLYVVDFAFGEVVCIAPFGEAAVVCTYEGAPDGLQAGPDGLVYISYRHNGIMRLDPSIGKTEPICGPENSSIRSSARAISQLPAMATSTLRIRETPISSIP